VHPFAVSWAKISLSGYIVSALLKIDHHIVVSGTSLMFYSSSSRFTTLPCLPLPCPALTLMHLTLRRGNGLWTNPRARTTLCNLALALTLALHMRGSCVYTICDALAVAETAILVAQRPRQWRWSAAVQCLSLFLGLDC